MSMSKYTTQVEREQAERIEALTTLVSELESRLQTLTDTDNTSDTNVIAPQDMKCFSQVAEVIGEEAAEYELAKIDQYAPAVDFEDNPTVDDTFVWCATPQGLEFWENIGDGITPKKYRS